MRKPSKVEFCYHDLARIRGLDRQGSALENVHSPRGVECMIVEVNSEILEHTTLGATPKLFLPSGKTPILPCCPVIYLQNSLVSDPIQMRDLVFSFLFQGEGEVQPVLSLLFINEQVWQAKCENLV